MQLTLFESEYFVFLKWGVMCKILKSIEFKKETKYFIEQEQDIGLMNYQL